MCVCVFQRDPAEEALRSNNMNLDQAMSECQIHTYLQTHTHTHTLWLIFPLMFRRSAGEKERWRKARDEDAVVSPAEPLKRLASGPNRLPGQGTEL